MSEQPERIIRRIPAQELMPKYLEAMGERGSVTVPVSGGSMSPFVVHLRDTVTLRPIAHKPALGDIVLYTRAESDGRVRYVMHRIVGIRKDGYVMCGDAQTQKEYGVDKNSLLAEATAVCRKGKTITRRSLLWFFFKHIWRLALPFRGALLRLHQGISGLLGKRSHK